MRHLTPQILLDLAEGTRSERETPHLATCTGCRQQLADLRQALETSSAAADLPVPEPPPLFWDHFSERVRRAVAAEGAPPARFWVGTWSWSTVVPMSALALAALAVVTFGISRPVPPPEPASAPAAVERATVEPTAMSFEELEAATDPLLALVADLAADIDWVSGDEVGFVGEVGSADAIALALNADERQELHRLLKDALAKPGV